MILTCPACQKKYLIPDSAIGIEGRQVRCAACRHSWFEAAPAHVFPPESMADEPAAPAAAPAPVAVPATVAVPEAEKPLPPSWATQPPEPVAPSAASDAAFADDQDPYAHEAPFRPRRNTSRRWTIAAVLVSVLLFAGLGAVYYFATPNFLAKLGIPVGDIDTPLIIQVNSDRGPKDGMPATPQFVTIHGQIINPTDQAQRVPDIISELLDAHGRVVYSWTITPPRRTIGPKGRQPIDDTAVNIPQSASEAKLTFSGVDPK